MVRYLNGQRRYKQRQEVFQWHVRITSFSNNETNGRWLWVLAQKNLVKWCRLLSTQGILEIAPFYEYLLIIFFPNLLPLSSFSLTSIRLYKFFCSNTSVGHFPGKNLWCSDLAHWNERTQFFLHQIGSNKFFSLPIATSVLTTYYFSNT